MNIIFIFGITILLMGGTDSLIEDTKTNKYIQQRILLRKLQNFQAEPDAKPSTWNEMLADVLVNKIRIFSFKNEDKEDVTKEDTIVVKERVILTNFFSKVLEVYKKIHDSLRGKSPADDNLSINVTPLNPESVENEIKSESEDVILPTEVSFSKGPKSEVELVEPKYHGKITLDEATTADPGRDETVVIEGAKANTDEKDNADIDVQVNVNPDGKSNNTPDQKPKVKPNNETNNADADINASVDPAIKNATNPDAIDNVDPAQDENAVECAEGLVKNEYGECVNNSRLMLAIPSQCPDGYRKDRLGFCRMKFNF